MTMFDPDMPDIDKKLQKIDDEDLRDFMKEQGYSDSEIEVAIRNTHLHDSINRLEDIFPDPNEREEMINILLDDGWERKEIEEALRYRKNGKE